MCLCTKTSWTSFVRLLFSVLLLLLFFIIHYFGAGAATRHWVATLYGADPQNNGNFGRIVGDKQMTRIVELLHTHGGTVVCGGDYNVPARYVAPTVLRVSVDSPIMVGSRCSVFLVFFDQHVQLSFAGGRNVWAYSLACAVQRCQGSRALCERAPEAALALRLFQRSHVPGDGGAKHELWR
jgi:hypothetical protein